MSDTPAPALGALDPATPTIWLCMFCGAQLPSWEAHARHIQAEHGSEVHGQLWRIEVPNA